MRPRSPLEFDFIGATPVLPGAVTEAVLGMLAVPESFLMFAGLGVLLVIIVLVFAVFRVARRRDTAWQRDARKPHDGGPH